MWFAVVANQRHTRAKRASVGVMGGSGLGVRNRLKVSEPSRPPVNCAPYLPCIQRFVGQSDSGSSGEYVPGSLGGRGCRDSRIYSHETGSGGFVPLSNGRCPLSWAIRPTVRPSPYSIPAGCLPATGPISRPCTTAKSEWPGITPGSPASNASRRARPAGGPGTARPGRPAARAPGGP